jgi:hypothetical protein
MRLSPEGTAELSPGRSPGSGCALEKSRRDDCKSYRIGTAEYFNRKFSGNRLQVTASRPYGTFRPSNFCPGLRPGLNSAVPAGLDSLPQPEKQV